jgi:uncharacterized protein
MSPASVSALSTTPIKGTRLHRVRAIELGLGGAAGDRQFYVIDADGRMLNGKQLGELQTVVAEFSCARDGKGEKGVLILRFGGADRVESEVELGDVVTTRFFSQPRQDRLVRGPFSEALSQHVGRPVRLVWTPSAVDRGAGGAASLISRGSLERLAAEADLGGPIDARRFRMLIEADGLAAHEEDEWVGRRVRVGDAVIRWRGHVGRCLITSRDPETGAVDLPTLDMLAAYRRDLPTTEPLPFGIYGEVVAGGRVAIGDPIMLDG